MLYLKVYLGLSGLDDMTEKETDLVGLELDLFFFWHSRVAFN